MKSLLVLKTDCDKNCQKTMSGVTEYNPQLLQQWNSSAPIVLESGLPDWDSRATSMSTDELYNSMSSSNPKDYHEYFSSQRKCGVNIHPTQIGLSPDVPLSLALIGSVEELTETPSLAEGNDQKEADIPNNTAISVKGFMTSTIAQEKQLR